MRELARQDAGLELALQATWAIGREAARRLPELVDLAVAASDAGDAQLALAASQAAMQTWEKLSLLHNRAFTRTLEVLQKLQALRRRGGAYTAEPPPGFADETACEQYFAERFARVTSRA